MVRFLEELVHRKSGGRTAEFHHPGKKKAEFDFVFVLRENKQTAVGESESSLNKYTFQRFCLFCVDFTPVDTLQVSAGRRAHTLTCPGEYTLIYSSSRDTQTFTPRVSGESVKV